MKPVDLFTRDVHSFWATCYQLDLKLFDRNHQRLSQPTTMQGIYIALDGLDAHYERALAEGAEILRPLSDTDYGSRETPLATWRGIAGASAPTGRSSTDPEFCSTVCGVCAEDSAYSSLK